MWIMGSPVGSFWGPKGVWFFKSRPGSSGT